MNWVSALLNGVLLGGQYALLAAGLSLMFGVMRIINLAHGGLAVIGAYVASEALRNWGLPAWAAIVVAMLFTALLGYLLQRFLFDRTLASGEFATPLVTFGLAIVIVNVLFELFTADFRSLPVGRLDVMSMRVTDDISVALINVIVFGLAVGILGGVQVWLDRTQWGRIVRATADDGPVVRLMGVNHRRVFQAVTAFALAIATLAGVAQGIQSSFNPHTGMVLLLFAFEAVVIGGLGSLWGTLVGGMILGVSQTIAAEINLNYALLAGHLVFLAFLFVRPRGIFPGTWSG
jgi:branched-chain amino acid transport system permease protein